MRFIIGFFSFSLIFLAFSCARLKDKPLEDLRFVVNDAFPPCERIVTKQTEKIEEFSENLYTMDSSAYHMSILDLEAIRKEAVETLETGIAKVSSLSNDNGDNLIRNSTLRYLKELLKVERELERVFQNHPEELGREEFYASIYEVYERNKLEEKGQTFIDEQYEFLRIYGISERDVEVIKSRN